MTEIESVQKIAKYLNVPVGKLQYNAENELELQGNECIRGFSSIIQSMSAKSNHPMIKNVPDLETTCLIQQLIDYAAVYIIPMKKKMTKSSQHQLLRELDQLIMGKSYFVGESLSLADLVLYFSMHSIYYELTNQEKESYWNLSRWFDHIQQQSPIRQGYRLVNLSTLHVIQ